MMNENSGIKEPLNQQELFIKRIKNFFDKKNWDKFKKYWHVSPEEKAKVERELIRLIEKMGGFQRRANETLKDKEYPDEFWENQDLIGVNLTELSYEAHEGLVGKYETPPPPSKKNRYALALLTIPVAAYGAGLPKLLGSFYLEHHIKPNLNPVLGETHPSQLDLDINTHSLCSADIYTPQGKLIASFEPSNEMLTIGNFSTNLLLGTDCTPGEMAMIKATQLDQRKYVIDMIAWAAYLAHTSHSWHRDTMDIDRAHQITTGSPNVTITVIESYFDPNHLELARQHILALTHNNQPYQDPTHFYNPAGEPIPNLRTFSSDFMHGTATSGLIAAEYTGVSPSSSFSFIQGNEHITVGGIGKENIAALQLAVEHNTSVISISLGIQSLNQNDYDLMRPIFQQAQERGLYIVIGAGNDAQSDNPFITKDSAGTWAVLAREFANVFLVEATDKGGKLAYFSQYGEISAPGMDIAVPIKEARSHPGDIHNKIVVNEDLNSTVSEEMTVVTLPDVIAEGYSLQASGTSFSTPLVAGTVALALSINPELRHHPEEMMRILKLSERHNGGYGINAWYVLLFTLYSKMQGFSTDYKIFFQESKKKNL